MADKPMIPDFPDLPDFGQMITQACEVVASVRGIPYDFNGTLSLENKFVVLFKTVKEMFDAQDGLVKSYKALYDFVNTYFENLDVQEEVNKKVDELVENGTLTQLITPVVDNDTKVYVNNWLNTNITNPTNPPLDKSLSLENSAANSKTVGDFMSMPAMGSLGWSNGGSFTGKISDYSGCFIVWKNAFDVLFPNAPYQLSKDFNYAYVYIPKLINTAKFGTNVTEYVIKGFAITDHDALFTF